MAQLTAKIVLVTPPIYLARLLFANMCLYVDMTQQCLALYRSLRTSMVLFLKVFHQL
jgi:hypothetical protein